MTRPITPLIRAALPKKPSKYRNQKTTVDGYTFDSKAEAERYGELRLMEKGGKARNIQMQVRYRLDVGDRHIADYFADFVWIDADNRVHVEDVKGVRTAIFNLKSKLVTALYGVTIELYPPRTPRKAAKRTRTAKSPIAPVLGLPTRPSGAESERPS